MESIRNRPRIEETEDFLINLPSFFDRSVLFPGLLASGQTQPDFEHTGRSNKRNRGCFIDGCRSVPHEQLSIFLSGAFFRGSILPFEWREKRYISCGGEFHVRGALWPVKLNHVISFRTMDDYLHAKARQVGNEASYVWKISRYSIIGYVIPYG